MLRLLFSTASVLLLCLLYGPHPTQALIRDETLPPVANLTKYHTHDKPENIKYEAAAISKTTQGACYSPFHNAQYPLNGGSAYGLDTAMADDFRIMKNYVSVVRTYYSSYFGYSVAKAAQASNVKLFLGVYMTFDSWGPSQYTDAVTAVKNYPDTISAILIGNENIAPVGPYTPGDISAKISELRARILAETGRYVPIGTVQRAAEWLNESQRSQMLALAANCDIVGVNIYPFFDSNYNANYPVAILNGIWDKLVAIYGPTKLRLTEIGFPTNGAPAWSAPQNIPSVGNAKSFYNGLVNWNPSQGGKETFWFMFFDRRADDATEQAELEKYFGFFTATKQSKTAEFPVLLSALVQAGATTTTTTTVATTPAPTTKAPSSITTLPPTTTAPAPVTIFLPAANLPAKICRVRKLF